MENLFSFAAAAEAGEEGCPPPEEDPVERVLFQLRGSESLEKIKINLIFLPKSQLSQKISHVNTSWKFIENLFDGCFLGGGACRVFLQLFGLLGSTRSW